MARTPEQIEADDALTAAILAARNAYFPEAAENLLTDYVVTFADVRYDDDGERQVGVGWLLRDNEVDAYKVRGLLQDHLSLMDRPCSHGEGS